MLIRCVKVQCWYVMRHTFCAQMVHVPKLPINAKLSNHVLLVSNDASIPLAKLNAGIKKIV